MYRGARALAGRRSTWPARCGRMAACMMACPMRHGRRVVLVGLLAVDPIVMKTVERGSLKDGKKSVTLSVGTLDGNEGSLARCAVWRPRCGRGSRCAVSGVERHRHRGPCPAPQTTRLRATPRGRQRRRSGRARRLAREAAVRRSGHARLSNGELRRERLERDLTTLRDFHDHNAFSTYH